MILIAILAATSAAGLLLRADEPKPPQKPTADFAGRIVVVQCKGGVKNATLENATIRLLGGRSFLVGKAINDDTGGEVWTPVDDIESLVVFETLGQLKRAAGQ
jgi:hypothetical protein